WVIPPVTAAPTFWVGSIGFYGPTSDLPVGAARTIRANRRTLQACFGALSISGRSAVVLLLVCRVPAEVHLGKYYPLPIQLEALVTCTVQWVRSTYGRATVNPRSPACGTSNARLGFGAGMPIQTVKAA